MAIKSVKVLESLWNLYFKDADFQNLRSRIGAAELPLIPFPGIYQSDLVLLDSSFKRTLDDGAINFERFQKFGEYVFTMKVFFSL